MRLLPANVFKHCKFKVVSYLLPRASRPYSTESLKSVPEPEKYTEEELLEVVGPWGPEDAELLEEAKHGMRVIPEFITEQEEQSFMDELEPVLKRMRYEYDHWDNAIHGFRETDRGTWSESNAAVLRRVWAAAGGGARALPKQHVLDLAASGHIKPHVDAVRFCGNVIAGLCLQSAAVMRLRHEQRPELVIDALLPRRGLYIMQGVSRYVFNHAVPGGPESAFRGRRVAKSRRVAVITRSEPAQPPPQPPQGATHSITINTSI